MLDASTGSMSEGARKKDKGNVRLSAELCNRQVETGRQAVLTHPVNSALWEVPSVMRLVERWDTYVSYYDLGAYGCNQNSESVPMRAVSTHDALAQALTFKREGGSEWDGPTWDGAPAVPYLW